MKQITIILQILKAVKESKEAIVDSISKYGNVQLKPSTVCYGVGVFATVDIPPEVELFGPNVTPDTTLITWEDLENVDERVVKYLKTVCNSTEAGILLSRQFNSINASYYVNHHRTSNVRHDRSSDRFYTLRTVLAGEEILCTYEADEQDW